MAYPRTFWKDHVTERENDFKTYASWARRSSLLIITFAIFYIPPLTV